MKVSIHCVPYVSHRTIMWIFTNLKLRIQHAIFETYTSCDRSYRSKLRRAAIEAIDRWRHGGSAMDSVHQPVIWHGAIKQVGSLEATTSQATCEQVGSSVGGRTTEQDYGGHQIAGSCLSTEEAIGQDCGSSMEFRKRIGAITVATQSSNNHGAVRKIKTSLEQLMNARS